MTPTELDIKRCIEAHEKCGWECDPYEIGPIRFWKPDDELFIDPSDPGAAFRLLCEAFPRHRVLIERDENGWYVEIVADIGNGQSPEAAIYAAIVEAKGAA